jgi:hypothetical protein
LDIFRRTAKIFNEAEPIGQAEQCFIKNSFQGGLIYCEKGFQGQAKSIDMNSMYPYHLVNTRFNFPIQEGTPKRLTQDEFNGLSYYSYGIYHCRVHGQSKLFKTNKTNYYTHYDLTVAKELNFLIEIIDDGEANFFSYSQDNLGKGSIIFGNFVKKLYELKKEYPENKIYKKLLNCLWGKLSQKNRYKKIVYDDQEFCLPEEGELQNIDVLPDGSLKLKYLSDINKIYKNNLARLGTFLTSFARLQFYRAVKPYEGEIIRIHTDSICVRVGTDVSGLRISNEMGEWKIEKQGNLEIKHVNNLVWS